MEPPDPFRPLLDEHADFVEKLTELEAVLDEMMSLRLANDGHQELLDEAIRFFDDELLPHVQREDRVVLPVLEGRIGRFGTIVGVVAYEHDEVRREVGKFKEARHALKKGSDRWPSIQELNRHGIFLVQFLWDHFRKEKGSLFPTARDGLAADELDAIRRNLSRS